MSICITKERDEYMKRIEGVVIATTNQRKIEEYSEYLKEYMDCPIYTLKDFPDISFDVEETGKTYEENARIKAKDAYEKLNAKGKYMVIADDSGIEIDALPGELGVHTARFISADTPYPDKTDEILKRMSDITSFSRRSARMVSTLVVIFPSGKDVIIEGIQDGHIAFPHEKYGYDLLGFENIFMDGNHFHTRKWDRENGKLSKSSRKYASDILKHHIEFYEDIEEVSDTLIGELLYRTMVSHVYGFMLNESNINESIKQDTNIIKIFFTVPESYSDDIPYIKEFPMNVLIKNFKTAVMLSILQTMSDEINVEKWNDEIDDLIDLFFIPKIKFFMKTRDGETWTKESYEQKKEECKTSLNKAVEYEKEKSRYKEV